MENTKGLKISGVKITEKGLKGLVVTYQQDMETKDGKKFVDTVDLTRKVPIGEELERLVKAFRFYLFDVYGYDMAGVNEAEMEVIGVKGGNGSFLLSGKMRVMGKKYVAMNTPLVTMADDYDKYVEVDNLIGQFYTEVAKYMEGKSVMSNAVMVKKFYEGKTNKKTGELLFDEKEFDGMSVEDQEKKAIEVLEKLGHQVVTVGDLRDMGIVAGEDVEEIDLGDKREEMFKGPTEVEDKKEEAKVVTPDFTGMSLEDEDHPVDLITGDDEDDLVLEITPVKMAGGK